MLVSVVQQYEAAISIHISPSRSIPHITPSQSSRLSQTEVWAASVPEHLPTSYLWYTWQCIYVTASLSLSLSLHPLLCPRLFSACVSIPTLQIDSSVPISRFYINVLIRNNFFFSFCFTSLRVTYSRCIHLTTGQFSSVAQLGPTLCDPMNHSTPGLPVHHQLPEFTQTHVHWVCDAIQPSHPRSSPSPPVPNPSQHQSLFQWVNPMNKWMSGLVDGWKSLFAQRLTSAGSLPVIMVSRSKTMRLGFPWICLQVVKWQMRSLS